MSAWLKKWQSRIDALALRERALLFVSILVCLMAAADTWWLTPVHSEQKRLAASLTQENLQLDALRAQLRALTQGSNSTAIPERADLDQWKTQIAQADQEIAALRNPGDRSNSLTEILTQFLRRHEGLRLVRAATIEIEPTAAKAPQAAASAAGPSVRRLGVELSVAGPYLELMKYVRGLEQALPKLRWGSMKLVSDTMPPQLTLQVFYVEVTP